MKQIRELQEFERSFKNSKNAEKPVMIVTADGDHMKTLGMKKQFHVRLNILTLTTWMVFLVTNAPGRSTFNGVQRRIAPLIKELGGVLLEHEHFGAHLDDKGNTIDSQFELKIFEHAGRILSEIISGMVINGYPVIVEYIGDKASEIVKYVNEKWRSSHVRSSQYLLQIVKCNNITCCTPFMSSYKNVVKDRFLPPQFAMPRSLHNGFTWTRSDKTSQYLSLHKTIAMSGVIPTFAQRKYPLGIPYDSFNPAVKDDFKNRMCSICGMHFGTIKMISIHRQSCKRVDDNTESNGTLDVVENVAERVRPLPIAGIRQQEVLCILQMREMEWMSLDDIKYDNIEDVPVAKDPEVETPLFDTTTEN